MGAIFMGATATQPEKFLFETVFNAPASTDNAAVSEEQLATIREEAYQAGFNAAQEQTEKQTANALSMLATKLKTLDQNTLTIEREAVSLAVITARKLASTLLADQSMAQVEAVIHDALSHMPKDIHLLITVNEESLDEVKTMVDAMPEAQFMTGKLIINGSAELAPSDCTIKWSEGEITRDIAGLTQSIDTIITNYLSQTAAGEQYRAMIEIPESENAANANPKQDDENIDG
jgi:flagellar biosynthesis/type III secretory pathway protein FliH